jgi:hypothetical protein
MRPRLGRSTEMVAPLSRRGRRRSVGLFSEAYGPRAATRRGGYPRCLIAAWTITHAARASAER